jgi:hypothetical protein
MPFSVLHCSDACVIYQERAFIPEIENYSFNFTDGKFYNNDGTAVAPDAFGNLLLEARTRSVAEKSTASSSGSLPFGVTSIERAIITGSIYAAADRGGRGEVFQGKAGKLRVDGVRSTSGRSISYSEGKVEKGTTAAAIRGTLTKLFFSGTRFDSLVTVYATQAEAATSNAALQVVLTMPFSVLHCSDALFLTTPT